MPIRSPRLIYLLNEIVINLDDDPSQIDESPILTEGGAQDFVYAKIKKGIGEYLGLDPVPFNDPIFTGTFNGNGTNAGTTYRRNIGGFRVASYKFISKSTFPILEEYTDIGGNLIEQVNNFRSFSIGLPKGHSVNEVIQWALGWNNLDNIAAMVTPQGRRVDMFIAGTANI